LESAQAEGRKGVVEMKKRAMKLRRKRLTPEELKDRAGRFYARYGRELDQIAELLCIKLKQLCLAYTINHRLPPEAMQVTTRVKKLESFLKKLELAGWPQFYYPTEVAKDLIGARVVCWFVDDCYGLLEFIKISSHFGLPDQNLHPIKDYISKPQAAGYRGIHVFADLTYDRVKKSDDHVTVVPESILCEVQIRSKLQDAWGDITHEFFYKAKNKGVKDSNLEQFLADVSERLGIEDRTLKKFRDTYQAMADEKLAEGSREGFRDES
jgi:putative GTP pyrophosphokinase